jgi:hypothetical protein
MPPGTGDGPRGYPKDNQAYERDEPPQGEAGMKPQGAVSQPPPLAEEPWEAVEAAAVVRLNGCRSAPEEIDKDVLCRDCANRITRDPCSCPGGSLYMS